MADLSASQLRTLESLRGRLLALKGSMQAMGADLHDSQQPLPAWTHLQRQVRVILDNIQEIIIQTKENEQLLNSAVAFPTPDFPAPTADNILTTLLRTKHEPNIEEWTADGEKHADKLNHAGVLSELDREELWASAPEVYHTNGSKHPWGADYTRLEMETGIQHIVTGLRRELVEPVLDPDEEFDDDDEEEEDEAEDGGQPEEQDTKMDIERPTVPASAPRPPMPVAPVLKFLATGGSG